MNCCEFCGSGINAAKKGQLHCSNNGRCRRLASFHRLNPNHHRYAGDVRRMQAQAFERVTTVDLHREVLQLKNQVLDLTEVIKSRLTTPPLREIPIFAAGQRIAKSV